MTDSRSFNKVRKVLYSPDFGAGWVTWYCGGEEETLFMLEYQPFIDYIEKSDKRRVEIPEELQGAFLKDFQEKFPDSETPYLGALRCMAIFTLGRGELVMFEEYDGRETPITKATNHNTWL